MNFRYLLLALATITTAKAVPWDTQVFAAGAETVSVSSLTVDDAGRVHTARVNSSGITNIINYRLRTSGTGGFSNSERVVSLTNLDAPVHISIGVTDDYTVQIGVVDVRGIVQVYEREQDSSTWTSTFIGRSASADSEGGISLRSGGNGSALVYTKHGSGSNPGGVRYSPQESDGGWALPSDIFNGADTGHAPTLITTGFALRPLMVISYNAAENRVEESSFTRNILAGTSGWGAASEIAPALTETRPDAEIRSGIIGVSFVSDTGGASVRVRYAELRPFDASASLAWTVEDVTFPSEYSSGLRESLGARAALTLDAAGIPLIAYTREISNDFGKHTLDVRARRFTPDIGWSLSILEAPSDRPIGFHTTDSIHLASGENGDPALIYERDLGEAISSLIFARPESAPWVVGRPDSLADKSVTSSGALATGSDGALHIVSNVGNQSVLEGLPFASYQKPFVVTYADGEETREELPSTSANHQAHAATVTPDGTLHVLALRGNSDPRGIVHFLRAPGGSFEAVAFTPGDGTAALAPIQLESSATGQLFCAYVRADGRTTIESLAPGAASWTSEASVPGFSVIGHDLAVRADGSAALTYFEFSGADEGSPMLFTNIDRNSGEKQATYSSTILGSTMPAPQNTACAIDPNGFPNFAWVSRDQLSVGGRLTPSSSFITRTSASVFPDGVVSMKTAGSELHITTYSSQDGGSLHALRIDGIGIPSPIPRGTIFAAPGRPLATTGALGDVPRVSLPAIVGPCGFPVAAPTIVEPESNGFYTTLLLARPADSLDDDGDRIPLLLEGAHCLDVSRKNLLSETAQGNTSAEADGSTNLFFTYNVPAVPGGTALGRFQHGEFVYQYQSSSDLLNWANQSPVAGVTQLLPPLDLSPACRSTRLGFHYAPAYRGGNPRRFARVLISRDR